jgi:hypothetical protein
MALYVGLDVFTKNDVNLRRRGGSLVGMGRAKPKASQSRW